MGKRIQIFAAGVKAFTADIGVFGLRVASGKFRKTLYGKQTPGYVKTLSAFTRRTLKPLIDQYTESGYSSVLYEKKSLSKTPVWFCLLTGTDSMTDTQKLCLHRLRRMVPEGAQLYVLTLKNISDFIDLPPVIQEKYQRRQINLSSLTEYVRAAVLCAYGGLWVAPSVFVVREPDTKMLEADFFSIRSNIEVPDVASMGFWNSAVICAAKNQTAMCFVRDAILYWWERFDRPIDDAQFDYFLSAAFHALPQVRFSLEAVKPTNPDFASFGETLVQPFDTQTYGRIKDANGFLDFSGRGAILKETADHTPTYFGKLYFQELYQV